MDWSSWGLSHTIDKKVITKYEKLYTKYWLATLLKANVLSCPRRTKFYFNACATEDILGGWGIFWVAYKRWRGSLFEILEARRSGAAKSKVWSTSTWRPWVCLYTLLYSLQMSMCKSHTIQNVTGGCLGWKKHPDNVSKGKGNPLYLRAPSVFIYVSVSLAPC